MKNYGLIGKSLGHSFSRDYFREKFARESLTDSDYLLFELDDISSFPELLNAQPELCGLNVTIPFKQTILPYLDEVDEKAARIGAVNTIQFLQDGKLKGWNTDHIGFRESLTPLLKDHHKKALIFGSGGSSKAVQEALTDMALSYQVVSRDAPLNYVRLDNGMIREHTLLINCTPLGMFPDTDACVEIPYAAIGTKHLLYDLIYNPELTAFLQKGSLQGAQIKNGMEMLEIQAEAAWKIWNS